MRGALEHAGVVGNGAGHVPPHRLLFCDTLDGKASIVRQLEPEIHIDASSVTVSCSQSFFLEQNKCHLPFFFIKDLCISFYYPHNDE